MKSWLEALPWESPYGSGAGLFGMVFRGESEKERLARLWECPSFLKIPSGDWRAEIFGRQLLALTRDMVEKATTPQEAVAQLDEWLSQNIVADLVTWTRSLLASDQEWSEREVPSGVQRRWDITSFGALVSKMFGASESELKDFISQGNPIFALPNVVRWDLSGVLGALEKSLKQVEEPLGRSPVPLFVKKSALSAYVSLSLYPVWRSLSSQGNSEDVRYDFVTFVRPFIHKVSQASDFQEVIRGVEGLKRAVAKPK